jgi:hypothetical protein
MTYKLKHLAKFCCKPANELEFEAVKMAAEIGGVNIDKEIYWEEHFDCPYITMSSKLEAAYLMFYMSKGSSTEIPVLDFCNKLRMTEEEAEKLEDDMVDIAEHSSAGCDCMRYGVKRIKADNGHYFKTNEDGTEVTLHKRD